MKEGVAPKRNWGTTLACAFILALAAVYSVVGDRTLWGEWITIAPPLVWIVLLLPTAVRLRSIAFATLLLAFGAVTMEWPRWGTSAAASEDTVRVLSWNIGAGNSEWAEAARAYEPDIVLVQEGMKPLAPWDGYHWYGTPDPGALLRFPAEALPTEKIGPWIEPQLFLTEIRGKKILIANVRMMLPSIVIQLVDPLNESPAENYRARVEQYEKLMTLIEETAAEVEADAILLAGDFNVPARMPSLDPLRSILDDAWLTGGTGWGATVPEFLPLTRIDQIWVSGEIQPTSVRVVRIEGSDHRAVIADLLFDGEP